MRCPLLLGRQSQPLRLIELPTLQPQRRTLPSRNIHMQRFQSCLLQGFCLRSCFLMVCIRRLMGLMLLIFS